MSLIRLARPALASFALAGCAGTPVAFVPEAVQPPPGFRADAPSSVRAAPSDWWTRLGAPELDRLVQSALASNPGIEEAEAALAAAVAAGERLEGRQGLSASAEGGVDRSRINGASFGLGGFPSRTLSRSSIGVSSSYELDLFGADRAERDGAAARADMEAWRLEAARLSLAAEIAMKAVDAAAARAEAAALESVIEDGRVLLGLVEKSIDAGVSGRIDRSRTQAMIAHDETLMPGLRAREEAAQTALRALVGQIDPEPIIGVLSLDSLRLDGLRGAAVPSEWLRSRPDILAAEAALRAAMADIGVSESGLYPQIRLTARWVQTSVDPGDLFSYSASGWTVAPQVQVPLVGRAALKAEIRRTVAEARRADARYRSVVVRAFSEAADALAALESADAEIALQAEAVRLSEEALLLERRSYQLGAGRLPDVISAQRQASLAQLSAVRAEAQRVRAIIRLSAAFAFAPDALTGAPG